LQQLLLSAIVAWQAVAWHTLYHRRRAKAFKCFTRPFAAAAAAAAAAVLSQILLVAAVVDFVIAASSGDSFLRWEAKLKALHI
jgi:hypothetical protein